MWIMALGYATTSRSYEKGRQGERVTMQAVAIDDRAFNIVCAEEDVVPTMTPVIVTGDLVVFDRNWSLREASFRVADLEYLLTLACAGSALAEEMLAARAERADREAASDTGGLAVGAGGGEVDPGTAPPRARRGSAESGSGGSD